MPGFISSPGPYFAHAKLFVQTSFFEGFGYVLVEAMAAGTPVIAYDSKGAIREILKDGEYGCLVSVTDIYKLAEKMLFLNWKAGGIQIKRLVVLIKRLFLIGIESY
jgi:glycosyltransferase involved in cell wall biosynthesis